MAINKIQFKKGLLIAKSMERYGTQEKCRLGVCYKTAWLMKHKLLHISCVSGRTRVNSICVWCRPRPGGAKDLIPGSNCAHPIRHP